MGREPDPDRRRQLRALSRLIRLLRSGSLRQRLLIPADAAGFRFSLCPMIVSSCSHSARNAYARFLVFSARTGSILKGGSPGRSEPLRPLSRATASADVSIYKPHSASIASAFAGSSFRR
jgi:hypothetical protein